MDHIGLFFADTLTYILVLGGMYFIWRRPGMRARVFAAAEIVLAIVLSRGVIAETVRFFYHHPRPFEVLDFTPILLGETPNNSFPSGHMTALFAFAAILYAWDKRWGIWYLVLSLFVGVARIYVGVHWPYDILGGIAIGLVSGWIVHLIVRPYKARLLGPRDLTGNAV